MHPTREIFLVWIQFVFYGRVRVNIEWKKITAVTGLPVGIIINFKYTRLFIKSLIAIIIFIQYVDDLQQIKW